MYPVILSGGSGTRLWPASRKNHPKQFLALTNEQSLLQNTATRLQAISELQSPIILCNEAHRFMVAEQLRECEVQPEAILLEPVGRNTAPAIALAALYATEQDAEAILAVFPSDHVIEPVTALRSSLQVAEQQARAGALVTFGIQPAWAETGYGYIQRGQALESDNNEAWQIARFVEKPDRETAEQYLQSGEYYWNSGLFVFRAARYLEALAHWQPEMLQACQFAFKQKQCDLDFIRLEAETFSQIPSESIDYAVMEKTQSGVVVPLTAQWNDVGSWSALWEISAKDAAGNVLQGDVICEASKECLVHAESRLVSLLGVEDLVVIDSKDALLVASKAQAQHVKTIVNQLKQEARSEAEWHREVYRPWGNYDSIDQGQRYQVKRITVNPGERLSLQQHYHRAEHWIVVKGTAEVSCDDNVFLLTENQSTYIPLGSTHRLSNPGKVPLELIEVQSGSYLGEDDIVRFDDVYGRNASQGCEHKEHKTSEDKS